MCKNILIIEIWKRWASQIYFTLKQISSKKLYYKKKAFAQANILINLQKIGSQHVSLRVCIWNLQSIVFIQIALQEINDFYNIRMLLSGCV